MWKVDLKKDKTGERRPRKKQSQGKTLPIVLLTKGKLREKKGLQRRQARGPRKQAFQN